MDTCGLGWFGGGETMGNPSDKKCANPLASKTGCCAIITTVFLFFLFSATFQSTPFIFPSLYLSPFSFLELLLCKPSGLEVGISRDSKPIHGCSAENPSGSNPLRQTRLIPIRL
ncbi:hypothetical protein AMTR_s00040p00233200 [Amborella trichopoda]|uniref:Uncharacterized protein n=1 Tax=Amborella trichopoda TaxID=13333 RepID=W1PY92_AMBTC|nr:hypothetical protein AMTR_s00040p00233200 [Amborella trichopoda]